MRITKVYTKTGDSGETSLVDGSRVSKAHDRVCAYGDVDELNSVLGLARIELDDPELKDLIVSIQNELFVLGADLATPQPMAVPRIEDSQVRGLEQAIDRLMEELEPLREFILPGGTRGAAVLHIARTVARRAESVVVLLREQIEINEAALIYLNRLSDLLFVMARIANKRAATPEASARFSARKS